MDFFCLKEMKEFLYQYEQNAPVQDGITRFFYFFNY